MTPPERLQDVTLAERLVAMAAEMDGMGESDVGDLLREAAAALSVRGDRTPIAWAVDTENHGRCLSFANEFIEIFPNAPVSFGELYAVIPPSEG